jgi:hypothetical protein
VWIWRWTACGSNGASTQPAGSYLRSNGGTPHNDALSGQVSTQNVIVMYVDYQPSAADANSPEAQTVGGGEVLGVHRRGAGEAARGRAPTACQPIVH